MMHRLKIFNAACKGCVNCIKSCPTEAIRVIDGLVHILPDLCIDCGECSRACPVDIPLYLFHKKVAKECEDMFSQASGMRIEDKPVLVNFRVDDSDKILE